MLKQIRTHCISVLVTYSWICRIIVITTAPFTQICQATSWQLVTWWVYASYHLPSILQLGVLNLYASNHNFHSLLGTAVLCLLELVFRVYWKSISGMVGPELRFCKVVCRSCRYQHWDCRVCIAPDEVEAQAWITAQNKLNAICCVFMS